MKNINYIIGAITILLSGCAIGIDDYDPKTSKSMIESKANGFFVSEYIAKQTPQDLFDIKEIWTEKC